MPEPGKAHKEGDGLRRLWGRRQAFALRPRQARLFETLLPRLAIDIGETLPPASNDPSEFFAPNCPQRVSLEIGFGGGEHLCASARKHPNEGFIGAEPFINGMGKMLAHIDDQNSQNIRLFAGDARRLIEALRDESLARVFLLFPDPWPKTRHHKRRFVQDTTLREIARVLTNNGTLRIASDIPSYISWTLAHMTQCPEFLWTAESARDWRLRPESWPPTRYEQKAIREGRTPIYLEYRRRPR